MVGTLANAGAIAAGGLIGLSIKRELAPRYQFVLKTLLGALCLYSGFQMVWNGVGGSFGRVLLQLLLALVAIVLGNLIGRTLGLQHRVNQLGRYARERFAAAQSGKPFEASEGFVTCTILFCVGPLAIIGALEDGLNHNPRTLLVKAALDGLSALAFVKVFGAGVILSALPVLAYQGTLTLLARVLRPMVENVALLHGLEATGGFLVAATALLILDVRKVRLADWLPALVLGPLLRLLFP